MMHLVIDLNANAGVSKLETFLRSIRSILQNTCSHQADEQQTNLLSRSILITQCFTVWTQVCSPKRQRGVRFGPLDVIKSAKNVRSFDIFHSWPWGEVYPPQAWWWWESPEKNAPPPHPLDPFGRTHHTGSSGPWLGSPRSCVLGRVRVWWNFREHELRIVCTGWYQLYCMFLICFYNLWL